MTSTADDWTLATFNTTVLALDLTLTAHTVAEATASKTRS